MVIHVAVGTCWFVTAIPLWAYYFRRLCVVRDKTVQYPDKGFKKSVTHEYYAPGEVDSTRAVMLFVLFLIVVVGMITMFTGW